ncbi:hypothetical protein [Streptomyces sp. YIM S03343]
MQDLTGELSVVHIVLVGTASARGFDMVAEMAGAGIEVTFVTADLDARREDPGFGLCAQTARLVEVSLTPDGTPGSTRDSPLVDRLHGRLGPVPPDGVICLDDGHREAAAGLARDLGLPHESLETARLLGDKAAVRARLAEHDIGSLRWGVAAGEAEGLAAVDEIGLPVVVRPATVGRSAGAGVVWSREDAARALAEVLGAPTGDGGRPPRALIEEYAVGRHVDAELLVQGDRTVLLGFAERSAAPPGLGAELGSLFPARVEQEEAVRALVLDAVRALGIRCSAVHAELLLTPTGPELIGIGRRLAGQVAARQMSLGLGRSLTRDLVALAVGERVREAEPAESVVAVHRLFSAVDAVVRGTRPVDGLTPEVIETHVAVGLGDRVRALRTDDDRFGHVIACGRDGEEAAHTAAQAARHALHSLRLQPVGAGRAVGAGEPAGDRLPVRGDGTAVPCGEHLLLLLGDEEPAGRILTAVGAVTTRVSVVWTGSPGGEEAARALWRRHCQGLWLGAATAREVRAAARRIHAGRRVRAALSFSAMPVARQLREDRDVTAVPSAIDDLPPGHTVLVLAHRDEVRALTVIDEEPDARLCPSGLAADRRAGLAERAVRAVRSAGLSGVVRCFFPAGQAGQAGQIGQTGRAATAPPLLRPGLDDATLDLYDAVHTRGLVAEAAGATLGRRPRGRQRSAVAVQRVVRTPAGPLRVVEATTADQLHTWPGLFRAEVRLRAGHVQQAAEPAVWLRHTVVADGREQARQAAARLERSLVLRTTPLRRTHVLLLDHLGQAAWTRPDGSPLLPADGFRLSVLSAAEELPGPAALTVSTDLTDDLALRELAKAVHTAHPVHRVAALSEHLQEPAARLRALLGTAGEGPEQIRRFVDRAAMRRIARRYGIRCADGLLAHSPEDVTALFDRHGKIVVKPRAGSGPGSGSGGTGSRGAVVLSGWYGVQAWLREEFVPGAYLCEEFVDAPMCHIDAVVHRDETVWNVSLYERDTMAPRRGQPLSSATVADPALRTFAGQLLEQVVEAWQVGSGVLHLEAFLTREHMTFCEVAARPGGAGAGEAFRATTGIDLGHAKILADAGVDPRSDRRDPVAAHAGWTVHHSTGGRLLEFDDSAVAPLAWFRSVPARVGDVLPVSRFSGSGVSTHVFAHDSHAELVRLLARTEHEVRIVTGPAGRAEATR